MNMFNRARLKLTAYYLLIIMVISIAFSFAAFNRFHRELGRLETGPRFERRIQLPPDPAVLTEIRHRLITSLVLINVMILIFAGGLGYWLAGKTLKPIEEMVEEQNRFISDASHELKTPITSLKTAFEVFLRRKKSALISESLGEVNRLQQLSERLLQLTYNEKPIFLPVNLSAVIDQAIKQVQPLAHKKKIKIYFTKTNLKIEGNREQLVQLLVTLLDNAIKYSLAKSSVKIKLQKSAGQAKLTIRDQGMGIDDKDLPRIFDRFYRADRARTKTSEGGYGLGLSIAKKIVAEHRGTITVMSGLNQGTTFQLCFSLIN